MSKPNPVPTLPPASCKPKSKSEVNSMTEWYKTMNPGETESVWIKISDLMDYIDANNATGLRILFARTKSGDEGLNTLVIVGTVDPLTPLDPKCETSVQILSDTASPDTYEGNGIDDFMLCPHHCGA